MKTSDGVEIKLGMQVVPTVEALKRQGVSMERALEVQKNNPRTVTDMNEAYGGAVTMTVGTSQTLLPVSDVVSYPVKSSTSGGFVEFMSRKVVGPIPVWGIGVGFAALVGGWLVAGRRR